MTYKDMVKNAEMKGQLQDARTTVVVLHNIGDNIVGRLMGTKKIPTVNSKIAATGYTLDTDDGIKILLVGVRALTILENSALLGKVISITRGGNVKNANGSTSTDYDIKVVNPNIDHIITAGANTSVMAETLDDKSAEVS